MSIFRLFNKIRPPIWAAALLACHGAAFAATVTVCASGCTYTSLQTAIDDASPGDFIYLKGGETYPGGIVLRGKSGSNIITIQPRPEDLWAIPPEGVRVTPQHAARMPKIVGPRGAPAIRTETGPRPGSNYRLLGLEVTITDLSYGIVELGDGLSTTTDALPENLEIDRCYIHGLIGKDTQRGISLNSRHTVIRNSYISQIHYRGVESQGIAGYNGPGPFEIYNNYIEAAGIGVLFGGANASVPGLVPSDITIERNYFFKPSAWRLNDPNYDGYGWLVKNMFELKNARNVVFRRNFLGNNWLHAQNGSCVFMTVRTCEGGDTPDNTVSNVEMSDNVFHSSAAGIQVSGKDGGNARGCSWAESVLSYSGTDIRFPCNYPGLGTLRSFGTSVTGSGTRFQDQLRVEAPNRALYNSKLIVSGRPGTGTLTCVETTCTIQGGELSYQVLPGDRLTVNGSSRVVLSLAPGQAVVACPFPFPVTNAAFTYDNIRQVAAIGGQQQLAVDKPFLPDLTSDVSFRYYLPWAGDVHDIRITNNLLYDLDTAKWSGVSYPVFANGPALQLYNDIRGLEIRHNTFIHANNLHMTLSLDGPRNAIINDNIFLSTFNGPTYGHFIDSYGESRDGLAEAIAGGEMNRNIFFRSSNPTLYSQLGFFNFFPPSLNALGFVNSSANDYRLSEQSLYRSQATDAADVGVNMDKLPLVQGLQIYVTDRRAIFRYRPPDETPCVLELSPDPSLENRRANYGVVPDVDPLLYPHADTDSSEGNFAYGTERFFVVGRDTQRFPERALKPSTTYYYRLQCAGGAASGSFETPLPGEVARNYTPAGYLTASPTTISIPVSGGNGLIQVFASSSSYAWNARTDAPWLSLLGSSGTGNGTIGLYAAPNTGTLTRAAVIEIEGARVLILQSGAVASNGLRFVPIASCRLLDTRTEPGSGLAAGVSRTLPAHGACGIPNDAQAYSVNVTAIPPGPLAFLTLWPYGQPQPTVSTLNSFRGRTVTNSALVPAGEGGAIRLFVSDPTHVTVDINGYFTNPERAGGLSLVTLPPCRLLDTRPEYRDSGEFGPPALTAAVPRNLPVPQSPCGVPPLADAYVLNATAIPHGPLSSLTLWPAGQPMPAVPTMTSPEGRIAANGALVTAGTNGGISASASAGTDLLLDINGYFTAAANPQALWFVPVTPCRLVDTRPGQGIDGPFGPPSLRAATRRDFPVPFGRCNIPPGARAYALNITVLPHEPLTHLTAWPTGQAQPAVSVLNSFDGDIVANAALVPAGIDGAISMYAAGQTDLIVDINGFFQSPPTP